MISRRLYFYKCHEYEHWLSEMEDSGWRLYRFKNKKQLEFKDDSSKGRKFIFLTTILGNKFYMTELEYFIKTTYKYTKFDIPILSSNVILFRLQIDQEEYQNLIRRRDHEMLRISIDKIGITAFLSLLLIVYSFININFCVLITLMIIISILVYYILCFIKFRKLSKSFKP